MDDRFFHAFLPPEVKVCGQRLTRFTVWHHFLLGATRSPVASGAEAFRPDDLLVAVRACQQQHGAPHNFKPGWREAWWAFRLRRNKRLFQREASKFFEWMGLQGSRPEFWRNSSGNKEHVEDKAPQPLALVCSLMYRARLSRSEAWNTALGEARWTDAMLAQISGIDLRFMDDADLEDGPVDLSDLTEEEALAKFKRDLPPSLVKATFEKWREGYRKVKDYA